MSTPAVYEYGLVERFYAERPDLGGLYDIYLDHAAEAIAGMAEPRFAQNDPEPKVFTNSERFVTIFGADTSHEFHPLVQHWTLDELLTTAEPIPIPKTALLPTTKLSPAEKYQLEITNLFHDTGEHFCPEQDVQYGKPRDHKAETKARHKALTDAFGKKTGGYIISLIEPVLSKQDQLQAARFNTVERIRYYKTGARAAELYLRQPDRTILDLSVQERRIAGAISHNVFGNHHEALQSLRSYALVNHLLLDKGGIMTVAHAMYIKDHEA